MEEKQRNEERKFKRIDVSFIVSYKVSSPLAVSMSIGNREFDAEALDLGEGGMAILTKHRDVYAIPTFTIVTIKFTMPDNAAVKITDRYMSIEIKGEVRSSLFMKELQAYRLGINFIDVSAQQRNFLASFVKLSK